MKISRKSKREVEQVFIDGKGWIQLTRPIQLRRLWWKSNPFRMASAVRFVGLGDYMVKELTQPKAKVAK